MGIHTYTCRACGEDREDNMKKVMSVIVIIVLTILFTPFIKTSKVCDDLSPNPWHPPCAINTAHVSILKCAITKYCDLFN
jgi:hypothetical protein